MKTLAVFSIFDRDGIIDKYILYWLEKLKTVSEKLITVVNGPIKEVSMQELKKYCSEIICRENVGYDAGAYKDVLLKYLGRKEIEQYDSLILCNDTCYGPFGKLQDIICCLSQYDIGGLKYQDRGCISWMDAFFLFFNKRVLCDDAFYEYWEKEIDSSEKDIINVYFSFESSLTNLYTEKGWKIGTYSQSENYNICGASGVCVQRGLPVLKKKAFSDRYFNEENIIFSLIEIRKTDYDIGLIRENVIRCFGKDIDKYMRDLNDPQNVLWMKDEISSVTRADVEHFIEENSGRDLYIYGAGIIAGRVFVTYMEKQEHFKGFLVTKLEEKRTFLGYALQEASDIVGRENIAIIVGMNRKNTASVRNFLDKKKSEILYLW